MNMCQSQNVQSLYKELRQIQGIFGISYSTIYAMSFICVLSYSIYKYCYSSSRGGIRNRIGNTISQISSEEQANIIITTSKVSQNETPMAMKQEERHYKSTGKLIIFGFLLYEESIAKAQLTFVVCGCVM